MTTTEHNVILPTFHLGGSSPRQLAEAYTNALNSIDEAMTHLSWTGPHGRDYYTNADGPTYVDARAQHMARMEAIDRIRRDLIILQAHALDHSL